MHFMPDKTKRLVKFALTGSSARKFKRAAPYLLAGRGFVFNLFPLTNKELGSDFDLNTILSFGGLPEVHNLKSETQEIDLIVEKNANETFLCEIKSTEKVDGRHSHTLKLFSKDFPKSKLRIISNDPITRQIGKVLHCHGRMQLRK